MYKIEYYTRGNGRQPAKEWRGALDKKLRKIIDGKIKKLSQYSLELLGTDILKTISGDDRDFYELRGGQCRVAVYYDRGRNTFILLHGWLKHKQVQQQDLEQARRLLQEFLSGKGE